jgi:tetratricopeptide (TPR) repeat protein
MKVKKAAHKKIHNLFTLPENKHNFELFYKYLSQPGLGLSLCQALPEERLKMFQFFREGSLEERIHVIDMVNPPSNPVELQKTIIAARDTYGDKTDIFFIYNIESCIILLKTTARDFFQRMNLIRDFFINFDAKFIFFVAEPSMKKMIRYAFDFYDWINFTFTFTPERGAPELHPLETIGKDVPKYSEPYKKIGYLKNSLKKTDSERKKSQILLELAELYRQIADYDAALERALESLEIEEKYNNHENLAKRYSEISNIFRQKGDPSKSLEYQQRVTKIREEVLGSNYPDLAASYYNLSKIYIDLGELPKAMTFQQKALKIQEAVLDATHPDLASSYNNISVIYHDLGKLEQALEFQKKATKIKEKVLGLNHPDLAISYSNISTIYHDLGKMEQALDFQERAVAIREQVLPSNHPDIAISYDNLSKILRDLDQGKRALDFQEKAVAIREQVLPPAHADLATSYNNIASIYRSQSQLDDALKYQNKAIKIYEDVLPEIHPFKATAYHNLSAIYLDMKSYALARQFSEKAVEMMHALYPNRDHPELKIMERRLKLIKESGPAGG